MVPKKKNCIASGTFINAKAYSYCQTLALHAVKEVLSSTANKLLWDEAEKMFYKEKTPKP